MDWLSSDFACSSRSAQVKGSLEVGGIEDCVNVPLNKRGLVSILRFDAHAHSSDIQPGSGKLRVRYNWVEMLPK